MVLACFEAVSVTVALPLLAIVLGDAVHVTFVSVDGTLHVSATVPVKPFRGLTETVNEAEFPRLKVRVCVEPVSWKSGAAGGLAAEEYSVTSLYASMEPRPVARS
jgi:hypothetical protein